MRLHNPFKRVPFIAQMERTECGAASLGMILAYHGCEVPLAELRDACAVSRDGATAKDIVRAAEAYGLEASPVRAEPDELEDVELPAIIHWELNHFLVLERLRAGGADLVDPAMGRRFVTDAEFGDAFTGVVVQLKPGASFAKRRASRRTFATMASLLRGSAGALAVMTTSAFLLEAIGLLFPAASAMVVDFVVRPRQSRWVAVLAVTFAAAIVLRLAITLARDRILAGFESRLNVELATRLVRHMISLPVAFFSQRGTGELLSRVTMLLTARETFTRVFLAGFDALLVAAYSLLMLLYDPRLGGIVVGLHVCTVLLTALGRRRSRSFNAASQTAQGKAQAALVIAFEDPEAGKAFAAEPLLLARYTNARVRQLNASADSQRAMDPAKHALTFLEAGSTALVLLLGGRAVLEDRMTLGVLTSFLSLQTLLAPPLERLVAAFQDLSDLGPILDRVDDVLDSAPEPTGTFVPDGIEGAITFENVSFRYGKRGKLLLDDVSFHVDAGERVALAGASGAGKSTILKLVLGFVQPLSGRVLVDGRDVREYDLAALRSSMGTVLAGGTFFSESVFDNVTLGAPEATPSDVRRALEATCVSEVVEALPQQALTRLETGAKRLSGGQRQRLLLTRALVKSPTVLLLDESSSALDTELERRVQAYLTTMRCKMLVVAHRLSAVGFADRVLFLQGGKIVQEGSLAALSRQPGPFRDLVRAAEEAS